jgi:hypothetical protein
MTREWRDIDFRPAPNGWRVLYLDDTEEVGWGAWPMAGWLIQEYAEDDGYHEGVGADEDRKPGDRPRRVIAAVVEDLELVPVDSPMFDPWTIIGPGDPDPTREQAERAVRSRLEASRASS